MQASPALNETRLPRQILRRSAAIEARLSEQRGEPKPVTTEPTPPASPSVGDVPPAEPPQSTTPPAPPAPPEDPRESDPAYWKQRFKVTEGVLRAERAHHQEEVGRMDQRLTELKEQVRTLQAAAPVPTPELGQFFTPEQVEELGKEQAEAIIKTVLTTAKSEVQAAIEAAVKPLQDRQVEDANRDKTRRQTAFTDGLLALVPDYQEVDATDGWQMWLSQKDEGTRLQRQEILNRHVAAADADAVAMMFRAYATTLRKAPPPVPPVTPHGTGAGPSGDPPPAPNMGLTAPSDAEVKAFYKRAGIGKVSDEERVKFEARLKLRHGG